MRISAARTQHHVTESIAHSTVGAGAKQLARRGRILEWRLVVLGFESVRFCGRVFGALVPAPVRRWAWSLSIGIQRIGSHLVVFVGRWLGTRPYWRLVGAIPAFVLALPLAYCMVRMPFYTPERKARQDRQAAEEALHGKDYTTANLFYRKLHQLGAMNDLVQYQQAYNAYESGDHRNALAQMRQLAPDDQPGFAPAHVWLARWYLNGESKLSDEEAMRNVQRHLTFALDRDPSHVEARALRAFYLNRQGRDEEAVTELREVVKQLPTQGLSLAQLYARQGNLTAARREVERVLEGFQERAHQGREFQAHEYDAWATGHLLLGQIDQCESTLERGAAQHPNESSLRDRLVDMLLAQATLKLQKRVGEPADVVDRLRRAWALKPESDVPLILLAQLSQQKDAFGQEADRMLRAWLNDEKRPAHLYAILGPVVGQTGDLELSATFLRQAIAVNPSDSYSLNNLAHVLMALDDAHFDEALQLVNRALEIEPNQPLYRETRGQLLVKMRRYREALSDLNFALNGLQDTRPIHEALAQAYEQLGQQEQARIHRQAVRAVVP
jgi:predicted Zn-dependent protease